MRYDFKNRLALVTGSTHGIGKAIAGVLAENGADIIICGRNRESLEATKAEIGKSGTKVYGFALDASKPDEVKKLFEEVVAEAGRLDILVNNVGRAEPFGGFFDLSDEDWENTFNLNFMSMVYFCRAAIPWLRKSNRGRIINIASLSARQPGIWNPHYSAAKAAMLNLNKHLANLLAKDNILVNAICPSTLKGGGWERNAADRARRDGLSLKDAEALMESEEKKKSPLGRMGTLEDIAELTAFLASERANFITGTSLQVDGGTVRSIF